MDKRKYWIIRLFFVLFTISVSVTIFPCGIVLVRGLFGEITTFVITKDEDQEIGIVKSRCHEKIRQTKGINNINNWFEIWMAVVYICLLANLIRLPRGDTIVTLKVRMDN